MKTRPNTVWRAGSSVGLCLLVAACPECPSDPQDPPQVTFAPADSVRPECPHEWVWDEMSVTLDDRVAPVQIRDPNSGRLSGPGLIQDVVEYHDCQRFLSSDRASYGELMAIFAAYRAERLDTLALADTTEHVPAGPLASPDGNVAVPAAQIYAEQAYPPLNIQVGFNCLYLFRQAGLWQAKMTNSWEREADCFAPIDPDTITSANDLAVLERTYAWAQAEHYPRVARWDWDPPAEQNMPGRYSIRVGCGASECLVGARGFVPDVPRYSSLVTQTDADRDKTYAIESWYDEQELATLPTDGRPIAPSGLVGVLIPHPRLGDYTRADLTPPVGTPRFVPAAYVALPDGAPPGYTEKFGLYATPTPGDFNTIGLCYGDAAACLPAGTPQIVCPAEADGMWWAEIRGPESEHRPVYRCVTFREVRDVPVPATVRWRWLVDDEGDWMRCPVGCCEVS